MADYSFVTRWSFAAPLDAVWSLISSPDAWPEWWPGVERVELLAPGDADGVGSVRRYTWKSRLPYRLTFDLRTTKVERPHLLEGQALGELTGTGRWQLSFDGGQTHVRYDWNVRTTKAWMNLLAPLARPVFAWNHDVVMRWGGEGLARRLGCGSWYSPFTDDDMEIDHGDRDGGKREPATDPTGSVDSPSLPLHTLSAAARRQPGDGGTGDGG